MAAHLLSNTGSASGSADIGADMATRQIGGGDASDYLMLAEAKIGGIEVTFSGSKRQA